jgi:hypothetical protein
MLMIAFLLRPAWDRLRLLHPIYVAQTVPHPKKKLKREKPAEKSPWPPPGPALAAVLATARAGLPMI